MRLFDLVAALTVLAAAFKLPQLPPVKAPHHDRFDGVCAVLFSLAIVVAGTFVPESASLLAPSSTNSISMRPCFTGCSASFCSPGPSTSTSRP